MLHTEACCECGSRHAACKRLKRSTNTHKDTISLVCARHTVRSGNVNTKSIESHMIEKECVRAREHANKLNDDYQIIRLHLRTDRYKTKTNKKINNTFSYATDETPKNVRKMHGEKRVSERIKQNRWQRQQISSDVCKAPTTTVTAARQIKRHKSLSTAHIHTHGQQRRQRTHDSSIWHN